jgi:MYXO-CTERM domain-containing protein
MPVSTIMMASTMDEGREGSLGLMLLGLALLVRRRA